MLSLKCEVTLSDLAKIVLLPSRLWKSREKYGAEWLLWPQPNKTQERQLRSLYKYEVPEDGEIEFEDFTLVYKPKDMISTMQLKELVKALLFERPKTVKMQKARREVIRSYFSPQTVDIIMRTLPIGNAVDKRAKIPADLEEGRHMEFYRWLKEHEVKQGRLVKLYRQWTPEWNIAQYRKVVRDLETEGLIVPVKTLVRMHRYYDIK